MILNSYRIVKDFMQPLLDRPLIILLPFYMWGIREGWARGEGIENWPLVAAAVCACLVFHLSFFCRSLKNYMIFLLIPCASLLGFGLASRAITEPSDPRHLIHFTSAERFPEHLILGGVVKEAFQQPQSRYLRLIIDGREIIRAGAEGAEKILPATGLARIDVTGGGFMKIGDYVRMPVALRRLSGFRNPLGLNPEKFWGAQGVWVNAYVRDPALISSWPGYSRPGLMEPLRARASEFLYSRVPHPAAGLLASLLLGRRADVDGDSEVTFRNLGLSHILSVSGLHLGLWYGLCLWLGLMVLRRLWPARARSGSLMAVASVIALAPALFYAALVGGASPVIRAAIMVTAAGLALLARRGADSWNIMAAAAWVILLAEPGRLFTASFQMSFVATLALVAVFRPRPGQKRNNGPRKGSVWNSPISLNLLKSIVRRDGLAQDNWPTQRKSFFKQAALASLAGTFGTAPLVMWHFSYLPVASLAGNLIFGPLLSAFVLVPGLLSLMALPVCEPLAALLMDFSANILMFLMPVMEAAAQVVGPGLLLPFPGTFFVAAYFLAGWLLLRSPWGLKKRLATSCAIAMTGLLPYLIHGQGERGLLRFTALDVGQGQSLHINFPDQRQMVIDGGGSRYFDPGERIVTPYLLRQGVHTINYAALTHPDEDHLKGLISLCRNFQPEEIWSSPWPQDASTLYREFQEATAHIEKAAPQDLWNGWLIGPVRMETLWPEPGYEWPQASPKGDWVNNMGQVFKITWGDISFLVTGDIEKKTERRLVELHGPRLAATVLIAPHHGSSASMSEDFLKAVNPQHIVFSVGRHNYFGHPHPKSLELAIATGAAIHRTDLEGAVVFEVREQKGQPTLMQRP